MKLKNEFTVPAPVEHAYAVLLDVERVAPCLPGAALHGGDGQTFTGSMAIKLGPLKSRFEGTVRIESTDARAYRAVMRAEAKDVGGHGAAAATITTQLREARDGTRVSVETDLLISGPAAQFGRGVMQDVSAKLMRQFADTLAEEMQADATAAVGAPAAHSAQPAGRFVPTQGGSPTTEIGGLEYEPTAVGWLPRGPAADAALAAVAPSTPRRPVRERRSADVLNLGAASRDAVLKRVVPVAAGLAAAAIAIVLWRRSRS